MSGWTHPLRPEPRHAVFCRLAVQLIYTGLQINSWLNPGRHSPLPLEKAILSDVETAQQLLEDLLAQFLVASLQKSHGIRRKSTHW